jgi:hypothetical protein
MGPSHQIQKQRQLLERGTPHHLTPHIIVRGIEPNFLKQTKGHNSCWFENYRPSSTRNKSVCAYFSRPSSGSVRRVHVAEELKRELMTLIVASSRMGQANP